MNRPAARIRTPLLSSLLLVSISSVLLTGCETWQPPDVVHVQGARWWQSVTPLYGLIFTSGEEEKPVHLLLRHGDLISPLDFEDESVAFPYFSGDGGSLDFSAEGLLGKLSGMPAALVLNDEGWTWLEEATTDEMASLRMISFPDEVTAGRSALLQQLASHNPGLDLVVSDTETLPGLLPLFDPERLVVSDVTVGADLAESLAGERRLQTLLIEGDEGTDLSFLPELTRLHTLIITSWDPGETGPLPDGLISVKSLIINDGSLENLSCLGRQPQLRELCIMDTEQLTDISGLAAHPRLRTLCLRRCDGIEDISALQNLKELRWLALPPEVTQAQFAGIINDHPGLDVLEAVECDLITDLSPIGDLVDLKVLIVATPAPPEPLFQMRHLKYLAVAVETEEDEDITPASREMLIKLEEALPETSVVGVVPLCLGSGFILLLIPACALAWWLTRQRMRTAGPSLRRG